MTTETTTKARPYQATMHRTTPREKTVRAYRAYTEVMKTAEWFRSELRCILDSHDLTERGFQVLEILYRKGSTTAPDLAEKLQCSRQNIVALLVRLIDRGWVQSTITTYEPVDIPETQIAKSRRGQPRKGPRVGVLSLTRLGRKFIALVLPRHSKWVKSIVRVLDAREQQSLIRICAKLREGDILKFCSEIRHIERFEPYPEQPPR